MQLVVVFSLCFFTFVSSQNFGQPVVNGNGQPFAGNGNNLGQPTNNNFGQPTNNFGQTSNNNFGQPTNNNFGQPPNTAQTNNFNTQTPNNIGQPPVNNMGQPTGNFGRPAIAGQPQPNANFGQQTTFAGPQPSNGFNQGLQPNNFGAPTFQQPPQNTFGQPGFMAQNNLGMQGPLSSFAPQSPNSALLPPATNNVRLGGTNFPGTLFGQSPLIGGFSTFNSFGNPFLLGGNDQGNGFGGGLIGGLGTPLIGGAGDQGGQFNSMSGQFFIDLAQNPLNYRYATCNFNSSEYTLQGRVDFREFMFGDNGIEVRIQVWGLPESPVDTQRGIHIHEFGDVGDMCARVGRHYNPSETTHGGRNQFPFLRHVGDLGNILQNPKGISSNRFRDNVVSLVGPNSVVGRSVVIKLERDDEGYGTNSDSLQNGNARTPLACCTIGRTSPNNWSDPWSENELNNFSDIRRSQGNGIESNSNNGGNNNFNFIGNGK